MKKIKHYLYKKNFIEPLSIGKGIAIGTIIGCIIFKEFTIVTVLLVVLGFLIDILSNRSIHFIGFEHDMDCPVCVDGNLRKEIIKEEHNYHGKKLKLPEYEQIECDNCDIEILSHEKLDEIDKSVYEFRKKVDEEEKDINAEWRRRRT